MGSEELSESDALRRVVAADPEDAASWLRLRQHLERCGQDAELRHLCLQRLVRQRLRGFSSEGWRPVAMRLDLQRIEDVPGYLATLYRNRSRAELEAVAALWRWDRDYAPTPSGLYEAAQAPEPGPAFARQARALAPHRILDARAALAAASACGQPPDPELARPLEATVREAIFLPRFETARLPRTLILGDWRERHWQAWNAKESNSLIFIPDLIAASCDESFSVRTRVVRSLGQIGHPAAIPTVREACDDPHPFARAQALRSLGHLGDAGGMRRFEAASQSDDPNLRRTALRAMLRVLGFWLGYGRNVALYEAADEAEALFPGIARDPDPELAEPLLRWRAELLSALESDAGILALRGRRHRRGRSPSQGRYDMFFPEAERRDAALRALTGARLAAALRSDDLPQLMLGIDAASRQRATIHRDRIAELCDAPHPELAWNARRALRQLALLDAWEPL